MRKRKMFGVYNYSPTFYTREKAYLFIGEAQKLMRSYGFIFLNDVFHLCKDSDEQSVLGDRIGWETTDGWTVRRRGTEYIVDLTDLIYYNAYEENEKELKEETIIEIEGKLMSSGLSWKITYDADKDSYHIDID